MTEVKQIIVLSGGGHKGVVRLSDGARKNVKGSCNLDFRPTDARLYLVGDEIAQIRLYDMISQFEVPFVSKSDICCVLRSSSLTMFGGKGNKAFALARVERFMKSCHEMEHGASGGKRESAGEKSFTAQGSSHAQNSTLIEFRNGSDSDRKIDRKNAVENGDRALAAGHIVPVGEWNAAQTCADAVETVRGGNAPYEAEDGSGSIGRKQGRFSAEVEDVGRIAEPTFFACDDEESDKADEKMTKSAVYEANSDDKAANDTNFDDDASELSAEVSPFSSEDWTKYDGTNFYYAVKPQLDEMFVRYPRENLLEECVQNSRWVRVEAPDGGYAVGVLYDGAEPAFICYGVPAPSSDPRPPRELDGMCVWLPASSKEQGIAGYWVIYQSAKTGEIIK